MKEQMGGLIVAIAIISFLSFVIVMIRRQQKNNQKARMFDLEVYEKETKEKVDSMDPDSLIDEVNKWQGKK